MKTVMIQSPIWHSNAVGIAHDYITDDLAIIITYRKVDGSLLYPDTYRITKQDALAYPQQQININKSLHIIPISALQVESEDQRIEREYFASQAFTWENSRRKVRR